MIISHCYVLFKELAVDPLFFWGNFFKLVDIWLCYIDEYLTFVNDLIDSSEMLSLNTLLDDQVNYISDTSYKLHTHIYSSKYQCMIFMIK